MAENRFACLVRIKAAGNTRRHLMVRPQFTIGRSETADLPLLDLAVSRNHALIEMRDDVLFITDVSNHNGITINGKKIAPSTEFKLESDSCVRLGSSPVEYFFIRVEAPMEVRSPEEQKKILLQSMADAEGEIERAKQHAAKEALERGQVFVKQQEELFRQKEKKLDEDFRQRDEAARLRHEKILRECEARANQEIDAAHAKAEEIMTSARHEAEAQGTKTLVEYEAKREKLKAEVDNLLAEGKAQQQAILADADQKYNKRLELGDIEKKRLIEKATVEAQAIKIDAENKAKILVDDAKKRSANITLDSMKRAEREIEDEKRAAVDATREATFAEQERIVKEYRARIDALREQQLEFEAKVADIETGLEGLMQDRTRLRSEVQSLEKYETEKRLALSQFDEQIAKAQKIIQSVENAEARREDAKREMLAAKQLSEDFKADYDRQKQAIGDDLQRQKEQVVIEIKEFRRKQDDDLAKEKLGALERLKKTIEDEEARYQRTLRLRSAEIATGISKNLVPKLESELRAKGADVSLGRALDIIKSAVDEVIVTEPTGARAITEHLGVDPAKVAEKKKKIKRWALVGGAAAIAILALYAQPVYEFLKAKNADHSEQREITLKRNAESIYTPIQTDDWHETYTGNVLYMRYYFEAKTDPIYQEQWSLRLNNLEFLRSLHLSEDDMVQFIGKERALITQLGELRQSLDAKYLDEGLQKMNQAESTVTAEMRQILKSDENVIAVHKAERDYVIQYIKIKFGGSANRAPSANGP